MDRLLLFALSIACVAAQFVTPAPAVMPAWLVPYPGVAANNRQAGNFAEASYSVAAPARDVLSHFRTLFASAGLPFEPSAAGGGFMIRAMPPECDLDIGIRRRDPDTTVKITCSPRLASTERIVNQQAQSRAAHAQNDGMKKFDSPVYPPAKAPLTWPSWLVRVDGAKLAVEKFPGQLKTTFLSSPSREGIQWFYVNLLQSHGLRVDQGSPAVPEKFGSWIKASGEADQPGRNAVIWVKIRPEGESLSVEISLR